MVISKSLLALLISLFSINSMATAIDTCRVDPESGNYMLCFMNKSGENVHQKFYSSTNVLMAESYNRKFKDLSRSFYPDGSKKSHTISRGSLIISKYYNCEGKKIKYEKTHIISDGSPYPRISYQTVKSKAWKNDCNLILVDTIFGFDSTYTISVPEGWTATQIPARTMINPSRTGRSDKYKNVELSVYPKVYEVDSVKIINSQVGGYERDPKVKDRGELLIDGLKFYWYEVNVSHAGMRLGEQSRVILMFFAVKGDKTYRLRFSAHRSEFSQHKDAFFKMAASFRIKD
ncbi:MAG: hypothetical protein ACI857_000347 [Arenicella sp.]|jgi:hypothetical protein